MVGWVSSIRGSPDRRKRASCRAAKSFVSRAHDKRLSSFAPAYFKLGGLVNGGETGAVVSFRRYVPESAFEAAKT